MRPSYRRPSHAAARRTRLSLPLALLLAVLVIMGLFGVAAWVAPDLAPAFDPQGTNAIGAPPGTVQVRPSGSAAAGPTPSPSTARPTPSPSRTSPKPAPSRKDKITSWEDEVLRLVNVERVKAGCGQVHNDSRLHKAARDFSALMAAKNFFDHVSPDGSSFVDREERAGYPRNQAAAENIAYGYADPAAVMKGWMNSAGHRRNILNCSIKAIGVGLAYRRSTPYWTQDFGWR